METLIDKFNKHLDRCKQCRNNPFNLCAKGELILKAAFSAGLVSAQHCMHADGGESGAQSGNTMMAIGPAGFIAGPRRR